MTFKFFVVPGNSGALLGMPNIEFLNIPHACREINAHTVEEKSHTSKNSNPNQMANNSKTYIVD